MSLSAKLCFDGPAESLYLITDRRNTRERPLIDMLERALAGGVRLVQLREKDLGGRELLELARSLRVLADKYGAKLLVNDRMDVARLARADGVHLGTRGFLARDARAFLGEDSIIGVSTHNMDEALAAEFEGADFITFGPVYSTPSKASYGEPVGLDALVRVSAKARVPVYAIGGLTAERIKEVVSAGATGVALISAVMAAEDVRAAAKKILDELSFTLGHQDT